MEGLLRSIVSAGFRCLEGRDISLHRYDPMSSTFPDSWYVDDGVVVRHYGPAANQPQYGVELIRKRRPVVVPPIGTQGLAPSVQPESGQALVGMPVEVDGAPWGAFYVTGPLSRPLSEDDLRQIRSLARQVGSYVEETRPGTAGNVELATVRVLAATVDAKDHYTRHHSANVAFYSRLLARQMNLDPGEVRRVELAGLLHDIGKIAVPDQVLQKPGQLEPNERVLIQTHAAVGASILAQAAHMVHLVPLVRHHHERYDGKGYPDGLSGREIPLGACILNLADSFDTMVSRRIYRRALTLDEGLAELRRCSGDQFHPDVVEAMFAVMERARWEKEPWVTGMAESGRTDNGSLGLDADLWPGMLDGSPQLEAQHRDPMDLLMAVRSLEPMGQLSTVLARAGEQLLYFWGADAAQIYLANRESGALHLAWSDGSPLALRFLEQVRAEADVPMAQGLLGWAAVTNQGFCVADARRDPRWEYPDAFEGPVSALVVPVASLGVPLGAVQLLSAGESRFSRNDIKVLKVFTSLLATIIERLQGRRVDRGEETVDPLTGVRNSRYLPAYFRTLERQVQPGPLSVAVVDGDGVREVSTRFGPEAGDLLVQHVARCVTAWQRSGDLVVRSGRNQFMLLFPGLNLPEAAARTEQIRMAIAETPCQLSGGTPYYASVSCGVTEVDPALGPQQALKAAEQAMRKAKRAGKNRVWTAVV